MSDPDDAFKLRTFTVGRVLRVLNVFRFLLSLLVFSELRKSTFSSSTLQYWFTYVVLFMCCLEPHGFTNGFTQLQPSLAHSSMVEQFNTFQSVEHWLKVAGTVSEQLPRAMGSAALSIDSMALNSNCTLHPNTTSLRANLWILITYKFIQIQHITWKSFQSHKTPSTTHDPTSSYGTSSQNLLKPKFLSLLHVPSFFCDRH